MSCSNGGVFPVCLTRVEETRVACAALSQLTPRELCPLLLLRLLLLPPPPPTPPSPPSPPPPPLPLRLLNLPATAFAAAWLACT
jgi:hypothetical protein